jgi:hypothetical protein
MHDPLNFIARIIHDGLPVDQCLNHFRFVRDSPDEFGAIIFTIGNNFLRVF